MFFKFNDNNRLDQYGRCNVRYNTEIGMFQQNDILLLRHIATLEYGRTGGQQPAAVVSHAPMTTKDEGLSVSFVLTAIS